MQATIVTAEEELKRNAEHVTAEDVRVFREWIEKQPHLPPITDAELILFLHACHYRMEPAKAAIDTYFTCRTHAPEIFTNRDIERSDISISLDILDHFVISGKDRDSATMAITMFRDTDASKYSFAAAIRTWCAVMETWIARTGTEKELHLVFDMKGMTLAHVARVNLGVMAKFFVYLQEGMPVRLHGLHFVNVVSFIDRVLSLIKPFMKKELIDMMVFHKDFNSLYKIIPKENLPTSFGGARTIEELRSDTLSLLTTYQKYLFDQEKRTVVEAKRPGKAKTASDLFGVEGSFKKLDLD